MAKTFNIIDEVNAQLSRTDIDQNIDAPDVPTAIRSFLGNLSILRGVPLYYIIPNEYYLPKKDTGDVEEGCIKMFLLDKEWIECLLDGALSVGPDDYRDLLLAKAMAGNYVAEVFYNDAKELIKKQVKGLYHGAEFENELDKGLGRKAIKMPVDRDRNVEFVPEPTPAQSNWCYSGFLMRSSLLSGWPGMEVVAKGKNDVDLSGETRPLQLVRFDKIADDTLFCLCEGIITEVEITQPPEGFHFAVRDSDDKKVKMRKSANGVEGVVDVMASGRGFEYDSSVSFAQKMYARPLKMNIGISWISKQKA